MNTQELASRLAEKRSITKKAAAEMVKDLTEIIDAEVRAGNKVTIRDFGTFEQKTIAARKAHNPKTGEQIQVPARKAMQFKPVPVLRNL